MATSQELQQIIAKDVARNTEGIAGQLTPVNFKDDVASII